MKLFLLDMKFNDGYALMFQGDSVLPACAGCSNFEPLPISDLR